MISKVVLTISCKFLVINTLTASILTIICFCGSIQVLKQPWPGMLRTVYGNHARFESVYFKKFPGYYYTGDGTVIFCSVELY